MANQFNTHTLGRAARLSSPFSLQLEIIPKALGNPKELAALGYTGNHPNIFKFECLGEWSEPSTLFLQPGVVGTGPEEEELLEKHLLLHRQHTHFTHTPTHTLPTPSAARDTRCASGRSVLHLLALEGLSQATGVRSSPKHLWATQRPRKTPNHPRNHPRIHKQPFARSPSLAVLSSWPAIVTTNRFAELCLYLLLNPTGSGRGGQKAPDQRGQLINRKCKKCEKHENSQKFK